MNSSADTSTTIGKIEDLRNRLAEARAPLGEEHIDAVHADGRLTARERVENLLDAGSFVETDALARHRATAFGADRKRPVTDGVVAGHGTIDGRPVCIFSQDRSIFDGRLGETAGEKIIKVLKLALTSGTPIIGIYDCAGARLKEGIIALEYFSRIYQLQSQASGVIPQIAIVAGPTAGAQAHGAVLADVVIEVNKHGFISPNPTPLSLEEVPGGSTEADALNGTAHFVAIDDAAALDIAADVLSYLPSNNRSLPLRDPHDEAEAPAAGETASPDLNTIVPDSPAETYDMREIVASTVDAESLLELQPRFAPNVMVFFARIEGRPVGIIASQPQYAAGAIDNAAATKAARFTTFCDCFNIPLVTFVDSAGFLPTEAEKGQVLRTAKLIAATAQASVGKIAIIVRKASGAAYVALGAKRLGTDLVFAWPTAEIMVADPELIAAETGKDVKKITSMLATPYPAAERGLVDAVIAPADTRARIAEGLRLLERKTVDSYPRKQANLPF